MKRRFFALGSASLALMLTVFLGSCTKDNEQIAPTRPNKSMTASARLSPVTVNVNALGYLEFTTMADVQQFTDWLTSGTHEQARDFMSAHNFTSKGSTLYSDPLYDNQTVSEQQVADYFLTNDNAISIDGIVMRLSNNGAYIYTLAPAFVNPANYNALLLNNYNSSIMNRFVSGSLDETMVDFVAIHNNTPTGYDDPSVPPVTPTTGARFWGWGRWHYAGFNDNNGDPVFVRYHYVLGYRRGFQTHIGEP